MGDSFIQDNKQKFKLSEKQDLNDLFKNIITSSEKVNVIKKDNFTGKMKSAKHDTRSISVINNIKNGLYSNFPKLNTNQNLCDSNNSPEKQNPAKNLSSRCVSYSQAILYMKNYSHILTILIFKLKC